MKRMSKITGITSTILGLLFSVTVFAAAVSYTAPLSNKRIKRHKGPYVGMLLGASETHYNKGGFDNTTDNQNVTNGTVHSSGFGQRAALGWQFSKYLAVEGAYDHYADTAGNHLTYDNGGTNNASGKIREYAFDLVGKLIYPLAQEVDVFGRLGVADIFSRTKVDTGFSKDRSEVSAAYGLGVGFNITDRFILNVGYNRVQGGNKIEPADLFGLGFFYQFH